MCDRMAARGPDAEGIWLSDDGCVGLGHRRLSIIDLSERGAQPMHHPDLPVAVVFNGEIYNWRELRRELQADGCRFTSDSDTEVLLHGWAKYGGAFVHRLRGMFAFALWDGRKKGLFLARDPYGIKPLYVAETHDGIRVASQVKALLAVGGVDTEPDPAGHAGFFLWGHVPDPHTLYKGIRAIPAGTMRYMGIDGQRREARFADIPMALARGEKAPSRLSRAAAEERLRDLVFDSVRHHLVADVPVGVFLSAGLDSTTLAALAHEAGAPLRTLTLGFEEYEGTPHDEVPLAENVAHHLGAEHTTVRIGRADFEEELEAYLAAMDQPSIDGVNSYFVSRATAQAGLKVALSGVGGDELLGGYPSFHEIPALVRRLRPLRGVPALGRAVRTLTAPVLSHITSPKYAGVLEYGTSYGGAYLLRRGLFMPWELPEVLGRDMAEAGWQALQPTLRTNALAQPLDHPMLRITAMESAWYMRSQLLRDTDWASMAHSLEVRTPLVDWALLSEVAPLLAAHPDLSKGDLSSAAAASLPEALRTRPKTGFTTPVRQWMSEAGRVSQSDRGLRGWARFVYHQYCNDAGRLTGTTSPSPPTVDVAA